MNWFNYYGLIFIAVIMIPNIVFAIKHKDGFSNGYKNKPAEVFEQIGRYGCFATMIFNIPHTWLGFYFSYAEIVYLVVNSVLVVTYCITWIVLWKKVGIIKAVLLSTLPSLVFLFSGIMIASILLLIFAVVFAVTHKLISIENALYENNYDIASQ